MILYSALQNLQFSDRVQIAEGTTHNLTSLDITPG
jgi:hypothetical protein